MSAVATSFFGTPDPDGAGLDGVLHALAALRRRAGAPTCCTRACAVVVSDVRRRHRGAPARGGDPATDAGLTALRFPEPDRPDLEFEAILVRRLAHRYLRAVTDVQAGRAVPSAWRLLLDPAPWRPARLALAGVGTLLDYDLTLALVGTATVLGRAPGSRERAAHGRVAAVLGTCVRELVGPEGDAAETALAAGLDSPTRRDAVWRRAAYLWTLRGRPAEAETARAALDREVRDSTAHLLTVGGPGGGRTVGPGAAG